MNMPHIPNDTYCLRFPANKEPNISTHTHTHTTEGSKGKKLEGNRCKRKVSKYKKGGKSHDEGNLTNKKKYVK